MHTEEFHNHRSESRFHPLSQPIIQSALRIQSLDALQAWMHNEVNAVIPHRSALLLLGRSTPLGVIIINKLALNIPSAFMQAIEDEHGQIHCPYLARWHATGESQLISGSKVDFLTYSKRKTAFFANELQPGLLDVSVDNPSKTRLFLYLFGVRVPAAEAMRIAASLVTPFAHDAWLAIAATRNMDSAPGLHSTAKALESPRSPIYPSSRARSTAPVENSKKLTLCPSAETRLTDAETKVLALVELGKRNKEIARLLGKSDLTVKKQVQSILNKLGMDSRMNLIARSAQVD